MASPIGGIYLPEVDATVQGSEELAQWRRRQLGAIVWSWAIPLLGLLLSGVFGAVGAAPLSAILLVPSVVGLVVAPGMTVVYGLRYLRAGRVVRRLPQMPRARIESGRRLALPSGSSVSESESASSAHER